MNASLKRRTDSLETAIKPRSPFDGLAYDEKAVLAIGIMQLRIMPEIERQYPDWQQTPLPRDEQGQPLLDDRDRWWLAANDRVHELREQGRLETIVERLRGMGRWPNDEAD